MIILGIETSCDETGVAVLRLGGGASGGSAKILSNLIASQDEIHTPYGGVVPELASRRHIEILRPMVEEGLKRAGIRMEKLDGIAVTYAPGLVGSLLVGLSFAKAFAFGLGIPFIGVSHLEGHLNAPLLENPKIPYPQIGLIVSGGHTALYFIRRFGDYQFLGGTRDDAAGEAFDKVAKVLGLGYPGGPVIDRLAKEGNPNAVRLPRPKLEGYDFSFSGLKTAVKKLALSRDGVLSRSYPPAVLTPLRAGGGPPPTVPPHPGEHQRGAGGSGRAPGRADPPRSIGGEHGWAEPETGPAHSNLCASFQEVVVDHLIEKTMKAARNRRCKTIIVTGGVACNSRLKEKLDEACRKGGRRLFYPSPKFCTDNAAMIAYTGGRHLQQGRSSPLNLNAIANLDLAQPGGGA